MAKADSKIRSGRMQPHYWH